MNRFRLLAGAALLVLILAACATPPESSGNDGESPSRGDSGGDTAPTTAPDRDYRIVTLLPRDAIPAIDNPVFLSVAEADSEYDPEEQIIGVSFNGQSRAYSISLLSGHEIVNDEVGGVKIAVTW
jgi:hypothetical protein